jgi:uridine kinase
MTPLIIAIGGGSGSGKTTLSKALLANLGEKASVLSFDNYYKDQSHLSLEDRAKVNYDSPDTLDEALFMDHLIALKEGKSIVIPQYDFVTHTRKKETKAFNPTPIIIVDGILVLNIPKAEEIYDYTIFVNASSDIRLARRILRDEKERGRTGESVIAQYLATVRPMHLKYVEPTKYRASFIFDNNKEDGLDEEIFSVLLAKIKRLGNVNDH